MANTTPIPPFPKSVSPPPPLIVLLRDSDFILQPLPTLLAYEDLPLKHTTHSEPNHTNARFKQNSLDDLFLPSVRTGRAQAKLSAITSAMDKALSAMGSWSPQALSSASLSPRATPMDNAGQSHFSSEPWPTTVLVSKIRKPRPKGAGRYNLANIVELEAGLLEEIKVCFARVFETPV